MVRLSSLSWLVLSTHVLYTSAGSCLSFLQDPDDTTNQPANANPPNNNPPTNANPPPTGPQYQACANRPAAGGLWACQDPTITFPTVACLLADMRTCGNVGVHTVFYSFGATTAQAAQFRDTLSPRGMMWSDALDDQYQTEALFSREDVFQLSDPRRQEVYNAHYAEALATASSGDAFVVVLNRDGQGGQGAYQMPITSGTNFWRAFEFPTLQRNPAMVSLASVDVTNNFEQTVDWKPNDGNPILDASTASEMNPDAPSRRSRLDRFKRDTSSLCAASPTTANNPATAMITPAPTMPPPSCELHEEDPDQGVNQAYCLCDNSVTLTPLSVPPTGEQSDSCAYTAMPATAAISITTQETVFTSNCQICTQIQLNAPTCTSTVQGCTPTAAAASPTSTFVVHLSNNTVHVGDGNKANNGQDFRDEMMSKLKSLCPDPAPGQTGACDTVTKPEIDGITTITLDPTSGDGVLTQGKLVFTVQDASYGSSGERDRMLAAAVGAFQQSSAKSCTEMDYAYSVDQHTTTGCGTPPEKRSSISGTMPDLICHSTMTVCSGADHINVELAGANGLYTNSMDIQIEFDISGSNAWAEFVCDLIIEGLEALVAAVAPELAPEELITTEDLLTLCNDIANSGS